MAYKFISREEYVKRIKIGLTKTTKKIGRPYQCDYEEVYKLRDMGHTYLQIANKTQMSIGGIQAIIRNRQNPVTK